MKQLRFHGIKVVLSNETPTYHFYRPKRSFGQGYVFTGVCDSVHRGVGVCSKFSGGGLPQIFRGGVCSKFSGGCLLQIFGGGVFAPNFRGGFLQFSEYGHRSAGTHPTGMYSCLCLVFTLNNFPTKIQD